MEAEDAEEVEEDVGADDNDEDVEQGAEEDVEVGEQDAEGEEDAAGRAVEPTGYAFSDEQLALGRKVCSSSSRALPTRS